MTKCAALSDTLGAVPLVGGGLEQAALLLGGAVQYLVTGVLNAEPLALATVAVGLIVLIGIYELTRVVGSFLALTGFFVLVICSF